MAASGVRFTAHRRLASLVVALAVLASARGTNAVSFPRTRFLLSKSIIHPATADKCIYGFTLRGAAKAKTRPACTYTVKVKTSCASPPRTTDAVSLAFGDMYRNEAHAARLPGANALGRCATDTFRVAGPCGYGVCYLYLRRTGRDGWAPEWVQVVQPGPDPATATFYFGDPLPNGVWYGHNRCPKATTTAAGSSTVPTAADARRASNASAPVQG